MAILVLAGITFPAHAAINASQTLILQTGGTERARLNTLGFETARVSTTYISTTLVQASGTPTANNHLTTKAYVDAAIAAASSGRPTYMGITSTTYTGALGGILGANDKCNAAYTGSRVMSASDIAKADYSNGTITTEGWLNCDIFRATTCYNNNTATGTCVGWSTGASNQDGSTVLSGGLGQSRSCNTSYPIHCVKD